MKIFIVCSKHFYDKIPPIKQELEENGHEITLPNSFDNPAAEQEIKNLGAQAHVQWKQRMLKQSEKVIKSVDALLILNFEKHGQLNYVGGATFLEIYEAFKLNKKLFMYNAFPNNLLEDELRAMNPLIITGDLSKI